MPAATERGAGKCRSCGGPAAGSQDNPGRPHIAPRATRTVPSDGRTCLRGEQPGLWAPLLELPPDAFSREAHRTPAFRPT